MKDLNLIPKSYILAKRLKRQKIKIVFISICAVIILAIAIAAPISINLKLKEKRNALDRQVKELNNYVVIENQINSVKELYMLREAEGSRLRKYGADIKTIFDAIEKSVPEKLFIASFNMNEAKDKSLQVTLAGICTSEDDIATFVGFLRKTEKFESVVISEVRKAAPNTAIANKGQATQSTGEFDFNIILYLKSGK